MKVVASHCTELMESIICYKRPFHAFKERWSCVPPKIRSIVESRTLLSATVSTEIAFPPSVGDGEPLELVF
ncbi:hypothetical protein FRX31_020310 [Thalictrum thalictroides]|uniref:Uncharacterized protein n=1 Tax=Thalictrum thalictroides TaxID=46969 RepID=A0A7J6VZ16_THATH|nr:hypothetical protein FRX31_020310 [Thalictrum thalictroides]